MFIVREIFYLHFGQYRAAKSLLDKAKAENLLLLPPGSKWLTDFTGKSYRLILELPFDSLNDYETDLNKELTGEGWKEWYESFKKLVEKGEREILRLIT